MITTQAPLIRKDFATGLYTKTELANKYRCHRNTISNVLKRNEEKDIYIRKTNIKNPLIMPYRNYIESLLKRGNPTAKAIYYSILDKGANISYSTVVKAVRLIKKELDLAVIRYETSPGIQGQVDWGEFPGFTVSVDGKQRKLYGFFMVLGYSRTKYVEIVTEMKTKTLIKCMENALRYFGGIPKEILFDNMPQVVSYCLTEKSVITQEQELVPEFVSFADYYGFDIVLCRIRRPQEKGKVERFVGEFKESFLPMLEKKTNHNMDDLNQRAIHWCNTRNNQIHSTTLKIPFMRLEREQLKELPKNRFYEFSNVKIGKDGSVYFRGNVYKVDSVYSGCEGKIIDLDEVIYLEIDGNIEILGVRDFPVYIKKRYSGTKQTVHQKRRKKKMVKYPSLDIDIPDLKIDFEVLSCKTKE
ncbi:MAG: IS21 family transposase [Bacilli bacterium]|nr:IS21 family transposase [Bacilli bacterium]